MNEHTDSQLRYHIPAKVVTRVDLSRLLTEAERVDNDFNTNHARSEAGSGEQINITMSDSLKDFIAANELNFDEPNVREDVIFNLRHLKDNVPSVHLTFSTEADGESLQQLVTWFREQVHPQTVLSIGLQPSLVAGVYLRTPNRVKDLSLRAALREHRDVLVKGLQEATHGTK